MPLFGKKQKTGDNKPAKKKKLYKTPQDVRLFYVMPVVFIIGTASISTGAFWAHQNTNAYTAKVLASSMSSGEQLPSWGRQTDAKLTVGNTILSADGKTMAVQVQYDVNAHTVLTSFGDQYRLRLVTPKDNPMKHAKIEYGIFGTDGSGVLTIHNPEGFANKAFVVMLIDGSQLVTSSTFSGDNSSGAGVSDTDLDNSITAQLSNTNGSASSSSSSGKSGKSAVALPPIYYVRLNAHNAKKVKQNWRDDRGLVEALFIKSRMADLQSGVNDAKTKLRLTKKTLGEMNKRLEMNPSDTIAKDNQQSLESTVASLQNTIDTKTSSMNKLEDSQIKKNILEPKQTKHDTIITDLSALNSK